MTLADKCDNTTYETYYNRNVLINVLLSTVVPDIIIPDIIVPDIVQSDTCINYISTILSD